MVEKIQTFLSEVRQEMAKVAWPSRDELMGSTVVVIVISTILTAFIFIIDQLLKLVMEFIL